jgi:YHS domain-containing protein
MLTRRALLTVFAAAAPAAILLTRPAMAAEPSVYMEGGIAIDGTDPVAYFTEGAPVAGSRDYAVMWNGTTWLFASAANMETFMMNPDAYAPQFGGYCAYAVSQGYIAPTVPEAWTIHDGKLYLNFSTGVRRRWERDITGHIEQGNANWPAVLG